VDEGFGDPDKGPVVLFAFVADAFRHVPVHDDLRGRFAVPATAAILRQSAFQTDDDAPMPSGLPSRMPSIIACSRFSAFRAFLRNSGAFFFMMSV